MTVNSVETAPRAPVPQPLPALDEAGRALLFTEARTANSFAPTPVTDRELDSIWDLAKWPPTAANVQPLRVLYVRTPEGRERLVRHMSDGNKAKTATAPAVAVLAVDTDFHQHIPQLIPFRPELKDVFDADETMRTETMRFSGALQAGYFLLAVRARGLAAGPMGALTGPASTRTSSPTAAGRRSSSSTSGIPAPIPGSAGCRGWITPTSSGGPDRGNNVPAAPALVPPQAQAPAAARAQLRWWTSCWP